ncbi:MAG: acyl-[acyl-carrier-protein]--UDP-N-acetylglucosamine O-acyltransferase, partial [Phycisphaerales bacterium]
MAIHPTAIVDPKAELDPTVEVGPYCIIEANVHVAAGCVLMHNVYLTGWTEIGENCVLHPGVIVGHAPQDVKYDGSRTYCRIGRNNILREYVTIHRGTTPESVTTVGDDCFLLAGS